MTKYHINEDRNPPELVIMYIIANELAEANRLKALELLWSKDDVPAYKEREKELVDQA